MPKGFFAWSAAFTALVAGCLAPWKPAVAVGALAGGAWNLASLWCFNRLLQVWLAPIPSRRRVALWVCVKFPLLYLLAGLLLYRRAVSLLGFGIGFTVVLAIALIWWARQAARLVPVRHGR